MRLAVWDTPFTDTIARAFASVRGVSLFRGSSVDVVARLAAGQADVALVPADHALSASDDVDILPAVAVSMWRSQQTRLVLPSGLSSPVLSLLTGPESLYMTLLARIVLKEHFGKQMLVLDAGDVELDPPWMPVVVSEGEGDPLAVDLVQEWSEMAHYPLVAALFIARKGQASGELIRQVRDVVVACDEEREDAEREQIRFRLDDLAVASLSELADYLFYYGMTPEIQGVTFASLDEEEDGLQA